MSHLTSKVAALLDDQKNSLGVFLDLSKAFDTVSIPILLEKLRNQFAIRGIALNWFEMYLSNRMHCTKVDVYKSDMETVKFGVPQGSILGPILFIMYINDIHDNVDGEIICYADDTAIIYEGTTWHEVFENAEIGLQKISTWLSHNLLTLNIAKSSLYVCFHKTASSAPASTLQLKLHTCLGNNLCNCLMLTRTQTTKYLGIVLDENLNFKAHTNLLSGRVRKIINIMKLLRQSASLKVLYNVYFALCQSLIEYCLPSWGGALKSHLIQLERAQRSDLKVMLKKPFLYPTSKLYQESSILSVRQLFILKVTLKVHRTVVHSKDHETLIQRRNNNIPLPFI